MMGKEKRNKWKNIRFTEKELESLQRKFKTSTSSQLSRQAVERAYHRIKATETTGNVLYSQVVLIKKDQGGSTVMSTFMVFPNTVAGTDLTLRLSNAAAGRYICSVVDTEGKMLRHKMLQHTTGDLSAQMDMTGLPSGIYRIVLWSKDQKYSSQVLYVH